MEMKKYMTPEMEVVELKYNTALLSASVDGGSTPPISNQDGDPNDF